MLYIVHWYPESHIGHARLFIQQHENQLNQLFTLPKHQTHSPWRGIMNIAHDTIGYIVKPA